MSTIAVTGPRFTPRSATAQHDGGSCGVRPSARRTRLRLTVRGRRVLAGLVAVPLAMAIVAGVFAGATAAAGEDPGVPAGSFMTVTAVPGDTLWAIAQQVAPDADPRDVVGAIVRLNAMDSAMLTPGQEVAIPARYAPEK